MNEPWWKTAVIYQIYPRSFMDTTGSGVGDLAGITSRLEYLVHTLGIDAIWISPFYPSPMADFGYDVSDYMNVHPMFGSLADFDNLLERAHGLGLKLIVDWVPNHTSIEHEWFKESRADRTNPKRDWYVWRDPGTSGGPPNNWLSVFGGPAWTLDETTGQFYLHSFLPEQPDLNWRNPAVTEAMFDSVRFWMDRGVDGLRIDVAHFIMKHPEMADNPIAATTDETFKSLGDYDSFDHVHSKGHSDVHDIFKELRVILDAYPGDRFAVGEIHEFDLDKWATYFGDGDELHMPYNFSLVWAPWDAGEIARRVSAIEAVVPPSGWPNHVLGNHDETRLVTRLGAPARARVAAMLLLTLRGTPTIYYGDEIGMQQGDIAPEDQQDPWGIRVPGMGRDGCRTPMRWDDTPGGGFTRGRPWLPIEQPPGVSVAAQADDPHSLLALYRNLLSVRRAEPELRLGDWELLDAPEGVLAYRRGQGIAVYLNFTDVPIDLSVRGEILLSTDGASGPMRTLGADEGVILRVDP